MNSTSWYDPLPSASTPSQMDDERSRFILDVVWTILAALGVVGNVFVLVVIGSVKELQGVTNILIANQSLIDLLTSLLVFLWWVPPLPISEDNRIRAKIICATFDNRYFFWSSVAASTFNLVFISLERYYTVLHPFKYKKNITTKRAL
ncbi:cholecystokinin receptor-like [Strongylocentrotus purpuratus]|uniref:G-protein coupled receptors family 1 profile domain-containing protein n=1 Tax=Strongylocentrotus purpuratus TaxID=7668 RepID=A0A7M7MZ51_STRPU|nr:cholecystokinin receptor-like [Strongylocentrotus purpuratus]XP_030828880.1 cholecystokinin receptor-like [Strongylocentrotus purpuratus]